MGFAWSSIIVGAVLAAAVVLAAVRLRLLSVSGGVAAAVLGTVVFGVGGVPYSVPLLVFFGGSSLLSRLGRTRKQQSRASEAKPGPRDALQVIANGGVAAVLVILAAALPPGGRPSSRDWFLLYLAALAAANADTWATEIGGLQAGMPRLVTTWKRVEPGTSGAITLLGTVAAFVGAATVAASAIIVWPSASEYLLWRMDAAEAIAVTWAGFVASLVDSVLGATLQARYRCSLCGREMETDRHCGQRAGLVSGLTWVRNDLVNALASASSVPAAWYLLSTSAWPIK